MITAISKTSELQPTRGKTHVHIPRRYLVNEETFERFKQRQFTRFKPEQIINEDNLILPQTILPQKPNALPIDFAQRIVLDPSLKSKAIRILIKNGIPKDEAKWEIAGAQDRFQEACDWAERNKTYGESGANAALIATITGIFLSVLNNLDSVPSFVKTGINILHNFALGKRGHDLYTIYKQPDDDLGVKLYQKEHYGNHVTGDLADLSCKIETKVKPFVLPFLSFLDSDKQESLIQLLTLPTTLFWRGQYVGYLDQRFLTHLMKYVANCPFALFGNEASKKVLEEINKDDLLTVNFMKERLKSLLELKRGETVSKKLTYLVKGLFSKDITRVEESAGILNEALAPLLGLPGFAVSLIGVPLKAISTFLFSEDTISDSVRRKIDSLASIGVATQQLLYSLRFSIKEHIEGERILEKLKLPNNYTEEQKQELLRIANERCKLSMIGLFVNNLNIIMPFVRLFDDSNPFMKTTKSILYEISNGLSLYFFPKRRQLRGERFLIEEKGASEKVKSEKAMKD
ncbi:MAG: hypothetical protein HYY52_05380 [Candidatus Melainabacteria bacterium]|nr:hypothetical protein [Candidatus Melainabacteria bacterium]